MNIPIDALAQAMMKPSDHAIARFKSKQIYQALHKHGISELAYKNFSHKSALHNALSVRAKTSIATEMARAYEIELMVEALNKNKLPYIVFKGTALAYFSYKNAWQRPRGDTDIVISRDDLDAVSNTLTALDYKPVSSISGKYISYQKSFSKKVASSFRHTIDVHWRISNRQILSNTYTLDDLLANSRKVELNNGADMVIPSAIDSILLAAQHRKGHHAEKERLIWLYDIHLLCKEMESDQWPMLIAKARNKKIAFLTLDALDYSHVLFDSPVPKAVTEALNLSKESNEPSAIFLDDDKSEMAVFWHDAMHGLPTWGKRLALLKEHLIPNKDYLKSRGKKGFWLTKLVKRLISGAFKKAKSLSMK